MLFTAIISVAALSMLGMAIAQPVASPSQAIVIVEASHGGAGNGLTNTTIYVPFDEIFSDHALDAVPTLYLTGVTGDDVSVESVTCTPYKNNDATGAGNSFTYGNPDLLSTNTVQVGSLVCESSDIDE